MQEKSEALYSIEKRLRALQLHLRNWKEVAKALDVSESLIFAVLKGDRALSEKVEFKLSKVERDLLGVVESVVESPSGLAGENPHDGKVREDVVPYNTSAIQVSLIPTFLLTALQKFLSKKLPDVNFPDAYQYLDAIAAIKREIHSRPEPSPVSFPPISEEERAAIAAVSEEADRQLAESSTPSPTDARKKGAAGYGSRSSPPSKTPHPGTPAREKE